MNHLFLMLAEEPQAALTMDEKVNVSLTTTFIGLVIVFAVLIFLTLVISLFGKLFSTGSKGKKASRDAGGPSVTPRPASPADVPDAGAPDDGTDDAIKAVIAAAVYAYGRQTGKKLRIKSIRRAAAGSNPWAAAGIRENTEPF